MIDEKEDSHRARPSKGEEKELRSNHDRVAMTQDKLVEKGRPKSPPKGPKLDQHAMDREACNAVRVAREEKRKARAMIGGAVATGKSGKAGRRVSYKYEDELQVENEAVRYR